MSDSDKIRTLANGGKAPESAVEAIMLSLQDMANSDLGG